jgi:hypothetical protein
MARVGRLAGALLAETENQFFLVGDLKQPCDFAAAGFEPPGEVDGKSRPYVRLSPTRPIELATPRLHIDVEGEALAKLLRARLCIERTGAVSERLWRLITHQQENAVEIEARWLGEAPAQVWNVVRESVLKCS